MILARSNMITLDWTRKIRDGKAVEKDRTAGIW